MDRGIRRVEVPLDIHPVPDRAHVSADEVFVLFNFAHSFLPESEMLSDR
jgi:hypothetical protein